MGASRGRAPCPTGVSGKAFGAFRSAWSISAPPGSIPSQSAALPPPKPSEFPTRYPLGCAGIVAANLIGILGQLVRRCVTRPTHLIVDGGPHSSWPYPRLWQRFADWERSPAAYVAEKYLPEPVQAKPLAGARRVIVKRGALTPVAVAGCDAIVLPISLYIRHLAEWPAQAKIMLLAPSNQEGQLPAHDDRVVFLGTKKAPLGNLLDSLGQACTNLAGERIASVGIGCEDEGPELQKWREQTGSPLELTIFCEEEGDVASFGPYADVIQ